MLFRRSTSQRISTLPFPTDEKRAQVEVSLFTVVRGSYRRCRRRMVSYEGQLQWAIWEPCRKTLRLTMSFVRWLCWMMDSRRSRFICTPRVSGCGLRHVPGNGTTAVTTTTTTTRTTLLTTRIQPERLKHNPQFRYKRTCTEE